MILYSENYGERIVIVRRYLKDACPSNCLVLASLLNVSMKTKEVTKMLKGGHIFFRTYCLKGGYVLETKISQPKTKGLVFVLSDPYKKATEYVFDLDSSVLKTDEHSLAIAKENALSRISADIHSDLGLDFASPVIDIDALKNAMIEDIVKLMDEFSKSEIGDVLYLGPSEKKDPLYGKDIFSKKISELESESIKSGTDAAKVIVLTGDKVNDYDSYLLFKQAIMCVSKKIEKLIDSTYDFEYRIEDGILDDSHGYIIVSSNDSNLPLIEKAVSRLSVTDEDYVASLLAYNRIELNICLSPDKAVEEALKLLSLGIDSKDELFKVKECDKEKVVKLAVALSHSKEVL